MPEILIIEDHPKLRASIAQTLNESGYVATCAPDLKTASALLSSEVDLVLLDLMLPDGNGLLWLAQLRNQGNRIPVLILTARDAIKDRVAGLDQGADDYLVKPFSVDELLARIRALLRRGAQASSSTLSVRDLTVDLLARTAMRGTQSLTLQNRQLELLAFLMRHADQIVTREMIARDVWKEPSATWTNVIEVHINQLRKQIERPGLAPILHTIRGKGYVLGNEP
ncbi:MAG: response regulator [Aureliella sp.]